MYPPTLTVAPAETAISPAEAKAHLRLDDNDQDALVGILIAAATAHLDGYTGILGRAIVTQTWEQKFDCLDRCLRLPIPAATIASITVRGSDGTLSTIAGASYRLLADALGSYVRFDDDYDYPTDLNQAQAVTVIFTAGYGAAADVPAAIKQGMLLLVGHWFENREAVNIGNITSSLPFAVDALLSPFRRVGL